MIGVVYAFVLSQCEGALIWRMEGRGSEAGLSPAFLVDVSFSFCTYFLSNASTAVIVRLYECLWVFT
jgi:hypothetical protein